MEILANKVYCERREEISGAIVGFCLDPFVGNGERKGVRPWQKGVRYTLTQWAQRCNTSVEVSI